MFSVRHPEAREGNAMLKDHDRYSLAKIIRAATTDATNGLLLISLQMLLLLYSAWHVLYMYMRM